MICTKVRKIFFLYIYIQRKIFIIYLRNAKGGMYIINKRIATIVFLQILETVSKSFSHRLVNEKKKGTKQRIKGRGGNKISQIRLFIIFLFSLSLFFFSSLFSNSSFRYYFNKIFFIQIRIAIYYCLRSSMSYVLNCNR